MEQAVAFVLDRPQKRFRLATPAIRFNCRTDGSFSVQIPPGKRPSRNPL
jgi:hypothetical protein